VTTEFGGAPAQVFTHWPIYVLAVVGPAGFILNQDAFQQGTFLAPVQAIITTADPVISIGPGVAWLGVALRTGPADIFGEVASLLLMTAGSSSPPASLPRSRGAHRPKERASKLLPGSPSTGQRESAYRASTTEGGPLAVMLTPAVPRDPVGRPSS
jgi:hypothetical protein